MYWSEDEDLQVNCVRQYMARNLFLDIKRNLRFNDNSLGRTEDNPKRLSKLAPSHEKLNKEYLQFGIFCNELSIDEQTVLYYGRHYLKQFLKGKHEICI